MEMEVIREGGRIKNVTLDGEKWTFIASTTGWNLWTSANNEVKTVYGTWTFWKNEIYSYTIIFMHVVSIFIIHHKIDHMFLYRDYSFLMFNYSFVMKSTGSIFLKKISFKICGSKMCLGSICLKHSDSFNLSWNSLEVWTWGNKTAVLMPPVHVTLDPFCLSHSTKAQL